MRLCCPTEAALADKFLDRWQFQFVSEWGADTRREPAVATAIPLIVERGNLPMGSNAGTVTEPVTVTGPYLKLQFGAPPDLVDPSGTGQDFTFTGNVKILRKTREFSRNQYDASYTPPRAVEIFNGKLTPGMDPALPVERDTYLKTIFDFDVVPGVVYYYTIYYESASASVKIFEDDMSAYPDGGSPDPLVWTTDPVATGRTRKQAGGDQKNAYVFAFGATGHPSADPRYLLKTVNETGPFHVHYKFAQGEFEDGVTLPGLDMDKPEVGQDEYLQLQTSTDGIVWQIASEHTPDDANWGDLIGWQSAVIHVPDAGPVYLRFYQDRFSEFFDNWAVTDIEIWTDPAPQWVFSPAASHAKSFPLETNVDIDGNPSSFHGEFLFEALPRGTKIQDYKFANDTSYRLMNIVGRMFDAIKEESFVHRALMYDIDDVDAQFIPYIDWLLAWPTNYELPSNRRRVETRNAVPLWKSKGTIDALELALQTITNWDISIYEGRKWVLTTSPARPYDSALPPSTPGSPTPDGGADWIDAQVPPLEAADNPVPIGTATPGPGPNEVTLVTTEPHELPSTGGDVAFRITGLTGATPNDLNGQTWKVSAWIDEYTVVFDAGAPQLTVGGGGSLVQVGDGLWHSLTHVFPLQQTFDRTNPMQGTNKGTVLDTLCYTPTFEKVVETGVGWWWQNPNGCLIVLERIDGVSGILSSTIIRKVYRIAPLFALHYAAFSVLVYLKEPVEEWQPLGFDYWNQEGHGYHPEAWQPLGVDTALDQAPGKCELYTYPHPEFPLQSVTNSYEFVQFHSWLVYLCDVLEEWNIMPQYIQLTTDEMLTLSAPTKVLGSFTFDPTTFPGSRNFRFTMTGNVGGASMPALSLELELWDVTNSEQVSLTSLATINGDPEYESSVSLNVGAAAGDLKDSLTTYEVRANLTNALDPTDFGTIGSANIMVT